MTFIHAPASVFRQEIADQIFASKYALPGETWQDTIRRVSTALFSRDPEAGNVEERFEEALRNYEFLPAGRIIAGAGSNREVTLFNCYVMGTVQDSIDGIFQAVKEAAVTMQQGGGIGYDFSTLRPAGAPVKGVGADASGPVSFMTVWDSMCQTIMSAGYRRGAMMATMRCDHPDIEAFIAAKRTAGQLTMFNLSVLVTDAFMAAVDAGSSWDLQFDGQVYRTVDARSLWDSIMAATHAYAEPGVIFVDRINTANNLHYCETISATNPCGEEPLPPYGACLLGSYNLAVLVRNAFTPHAELDLARIRALAPVVVRALDNVIDLSLFPLEQQAEEARRKRRMGIGFTGLGNALVMCGLTYGSAEAVAMAGTWGKVIRDALYNASIDLAIERGSFEMFQCEPFLASGFAQTLPNEIRERIRVHGIRNSHLLAIAPTGTISLLANNVSSGIEPSFSWMYHRNITQPNGSRISQPVYDYAYLAYTQSRGLDRDDAATLASLPPEFVSAQTLAPKEHLAMLGAVSPYIDAAVSKTINVPAEISIEEFKDVYLTAYRMGAKGCTTYRPNDVTGSILTTDQPVMAVEPAPAPVEAKPIARLADADGRTYRVKDPASDETIYITVNHAPVPGTNQQRVYQVFANTFDSVAEELLKTACVAITTVYQSGDQSMVDTLMSRYAKVRGDNSIWYDNRNFTSLLPLLVHVVRKREAELALERAIEPVAVPQVPPVAAAEAPARARHACGRCGSDHLKVEGGCMTCLDCGHSKCG